MAYNTTGFFIYCSKRVQSCILLNAYSAFVLNFDLRRSPWRNDPTLEHLKKSFNFYDLGKPNLIPIENPHCNLIAEIYWSQICFICVCMTYATGSQSLSLRSHFKDHTVNLYICSIHLGVGPQVPLGKDPLE